MRSFILKSILAVLTVIAVASCSTSSKLNAVKTLTSAPWELSTINGQTADVNQFRTGIPFLLFEKGGLLKGSTGCNNFNGHHLDQARRGDLDSGDLRAGRRLHRPGARQRFHPSRLDGEPRALDR